MKKIPIITIIRSDSPGAIYQSIATFYVVKQIGYAPYFVCSYEDIISKKALFLNLLKGKKKSFYKNTYCYIERNLPYRVINYMHQKLTDFSNVVIIGSDQLLNPALCGYFFFPNMFENIGSILFSSSFGGFFLSNKVDKNLFVGAKQISVREYDESQILQSSGIDNVHILDPTFLVSRDIWDLYANNYNIKQKDYILVVGNYYKQKTINFAIELGKIMSKRVILTNYYGVKRIKGVKLINTSSAFEILTMIRSASVVVSHSFHIFALSLIFNKNIYPCFNQNEANNNRFLSLINDLKIPNYNFYEADNVVPIKQCDMYNWTEINQTISIERKKGLSFIRNALNKYDR